MPFCTFKSNTKSLASFADAVSEDLASCGASCSTEEISANEARASNPFRGVRAIAVSKALLSQGFMVLIGSW